MVGIFIIFLIHFRSCFTHEYRLPIGKYHAVRHITCAVSANIDLHKNPLIHRRRDGGPPLLGGAAPFSSRFQRATFPAIGKVYPTKIFTKSGEGRWVESYTPLKFFASFTTGRVKRNEVFLPFKNSASTRYGCSPAFAQTGVSRAEQKPRFSASNMSSAARSVL